MKNTTIIAVLSLLLALATQSAHADSGERPGAERREAYRAEMQIFREELKAGVESGAFTQEEAREQMKAKKIAGMEEKRTAMWERKEQKLVEAGKTTEEIAAIKERMQNKFESFKAEKKALVESLKAEGKTKEEIREVLKQKKAERRAEIKETREMYKGQRAEVKEAIKEGRSSIKELRESGASQEEVQAAKQALRAEIAERFKAEIAAATEDAPRPNFFNRLFNRDAKSIREAKIYDMEAQLEDTGASADEIATIVETVESDTEQFTDYIAD